MATTSYKIDLTFILDKLMNLVETAPSVKHLQMLMCDKQMVDRMKMNEEVWKIFENNIKYRIYELTQKKIE